MLKSDDARLCLNYAACKNFQAAWNHPNKVSCDGCAGDITHLRQLRRIIAGHMQPVIDQIQHNKPEVIGPQMQDALMKVKVDLEAEGLTQHPNEAILTTIYWLLWQQAELEATIRRAAGS